MLHEGVPAVVARAAGDPAVGDVGLATVGPTDDVLSGAVVVLGGIAIERGRATAPAAGHTVEGDQTFLERSLRWFMPSEPVNDVGCAHLTSLTPARSQ